MMTIDDSHVPYPEEDHLLRITPTLAIPRGELQFRTSRSSGPGGQHVNKTETRVELLFDLAHSPTLTEEQRARLWPALAPWLDAEGVVHIVSERYRSQYRNREDAIERFVAVLHEALRPRKVRRPTRVPRAAHEARLAVKRQQGERKRLRQHRKDSGWDS